MQIQNHSLRKILDNSARIDLWIREIGIRSWNAKPISLGIPRELLLRHVFFKCLDCFFYYFDFFGGGTLVGIALLVVFDDAPLELPVALPDRGFPFVPLFTSLLEFADR
jgi:hypothetical protein